MAASPSFTAELEACAVIREVNRQGIALYVENGRLVSFPRDSIPMNLWIRVSRHRKQIAWLLMERAR